jgi:hypothetical protein
VSPEGKKKGHGQDARATHGQDAHATNVGAFELLFRGAKLAQVRRRGGEGLLYEGDYQLPLGGGRSFVVAGWDECFPSIEPFGPCPTMGELIGPPAGLSHDRDRVTQQWRTARFEVRRTFAAGAEGGLELTFEADNLAGEPLEFLWASHALFSFGGLRRIVLADGTVLADFRLDATTRKFFVPAGPPVAIERDDGLWHLVTDQPWWGIWLNRGGWPAGRAAGFGCIGIEATNATADLPQGQRLAPGQTFRGKVTLRPPGA